MEQYQFELADAQAHIEEINGRIAQLEQERVVWEQIGHRAVAAMMGVHDGNRTV